MNTGFKRITFFLPNIFTALNLGCGFAAIILSVNGRYYDAAMILILGAVFDSVDGRIARLTETQSSFGEQFDSMSDIISFGLAPAFLVYQKYLLNFGRLGATIAFVYLLCAALRLARFNSNTDKISSSYFQGLPSPGAALAIVGYILLAEKFPVLDEISLLPPVYTLLYGLLMVTTIPFNSFKDNPWIKKHRRSALFILFINFCFNFYLLSRYVCVGDGCLYINFFNFLS